MQPIKLSVEDRLDIQELFAKYCWGLNTGDIDAVLACFSADGFLEHPPQGRFHGHDKIRAIIEELWYARPGWFVGRQHLANHFLMSREGDAVRVKAYWTIAQRDMESMQLYLFSLGHWDNLCVKRGDTWQFKELIVAIWKPDANPWVGDQRARYQRAGNILA
jgi:hypothetical protein